MEAEERAESAAAAARRGAPRLGALPGVRAPAAAAAADSDASDSDDELGSDGYDSADERALDEAVGAVTEEDERALAAFGAAPPAGGQRTLADIIMEKLNEHGGGAAAARPMEGAESGPAAPAGMDPQVAEVYASVGRLLSRYKSGKVPKAFKIIPNLSNWEEVLFLTAPDKWTPHALYQATRIFASNLNPRMAQRFYNLVLLPRFRDDVREHKKVHFTLFQALKKATYKPAAFYKGLLLPLCQSRSCTLREAVILTSVLQRTSIPVLHSSAALLKLAQMPYSGTTSFFIRVLLDKKYALPYRVVDAVLEHFVDFAADERVLPVVWHQALLTFAQRYKHEIAVEDKERLRALIKVQRHHLVSPEVARELAHGRSRGEKAGGEGERRGAGPRRALDEDMRDMPSVQVDDMEY